MNQCHLHLNLSDEISRTYFQTKHLLRNTENTENIKQTQILLLLYKIRHNSCKSWLLMKVIIIKNDTLSSLFSQPFTQITHHLVHSASFMLSVLFNTFHFSTTSSSSSSPLLSRSFSDTPPRVMCWGNALFFSFQAWLSYWGPCLISIWFPCSPVACGTSLLQSQSLQGGDALTFWSRVFAFPGFWDNEVSSKVFLMSKMKLNWRSRFCLFNSTVR